MAKVGERTREQRMAAATNRLLSVRMQAAAIVEGLEEVQSILEQTFKSQPREAMAEDDPRARHNRANYHPSGKVGREVLANTPLGREYDHFAPPTPFALIGFWWEGGTKFVASQQTYKII